jgi:hypothetical protein
MADRTISLFGSGRIGADRPEFVMVWELKNRKFLDRTKPIILMGEFWKPVVELVSLDQPKCAGCVAFAREPHEVVELIERAL